MIRGADTGSLGGVRPVGVGVPEGGRRTTTVDLIVVRVHGVVGVRALALGTRHEEFPDGTKPSGRHPGDKSDGEGEQMAGRSWGHQASGIRYCPSSAA